MHVIIISLFILIFFCASDFHTPFDDPLNIDSQNFC